MVLSGAVPLLLPGVGDGSRVRLRILRGKAVADLGSGEDKRPSTGLNSSPALFLSFVVRERPLLAWYFLCLFLGTSNGEQCWQEPSARGRSVPTPMYSVPNLNGLAQKLV